MSKKPETRNLQPELLDEKRFTFSGMPRTRCFDSDGSCLCAQRGEIAPLFIRRRDTYQILLGKCSDIRHRRHDLRLDRVAIALRRLLHRHMCTIGPAEARAGRRGRTGARHCAPLARPQLPIRGLFEETGQVTAEPGLISQRVRTGLVESHGALVDNVPARPHKLIRFIWLIWFNQVRNKPEKPATPHASRDTHHEPGYHTNNIR
jgi:hypothetical protein